MTKTLKPDIGYYAYHNGNWGTCAISPDVEVWSCCMNEKKTGEVNIVSKFILKGIRVVSKLK